MSLKNKVEDEIQAYHQFMHDAMVKAYAVHVKRDINGNPLEYEDMFGGEGHVLYHLFRGHAEGEGHADRILDDYLGRAKLGYPVKCKFSEEYRAFLRKERNYGVQSPPLSLRRRLLKVA